MHGCRQDFNDLFTEAASTLESLFRLAGHGKWARSFKPSRWYKGIKAAGR